MPKDLLKAAIRSNDPVLFIEHATLYQVRGEVPEGDYVIPIGKSKVQRPGKDVTIVTYSKGLEISMKAAEELAKEGIEAEIVDLRTLRPLDMDPVIESFKKTNRAVIVEEGWKSFGVGAEISSRIYEQAFDYVDAPVQRVAQKEVPLPYNRTLGAIRSAAGGGCGCGGQGGVVMAEIINMPKLGFDMAEGTLVRWVKKVGETVNKGEVLAEIETDKATVEVESSASGVVRKLLVDEGAVVPVNSPIAVVGTADEVITEEAVSKTVGAGEKDQMSKDVNRAVTIPTDDGSCRCQFCFRSLDRSGESIAMAKKIASDAKIDLSSIRGSGPGGRIVRRDIEAALSLHKSFTIANSGRCK